MITFNISLCFRVISLTGTGTGMKLTHSRADSSAVLNDINHIFVFKQTY